MTKNKYRETVNYYKKLKNRWFIEFLDDIAYISDGCMIIAMDKDEYTRYIIPKIAGIPQYTENKKYTIEKGVCIEGTNNLAKWYKQAFNVSFIDAYKSSILIDTSTMYSGSSTMARAFTWNVNGKTEGALINDWFYDISTEHSDGSYYATKKNAPILTNGEVVAGTGMIILPIHYKDYSAFGQILECMNAKRKLDELKQTA